MMDYLFGSLDIATLEAHALEAQDWGSSYTEILLSKVREIFTGLDPT